MTDKPKPFLGSPVSLAEFDTNGDLRVSAIRIPKDQIVAFVRWIEENAPADLRWPSASAFAVEPRS